MRRSSPRCSARCAGRTMPASSIRISTWGTSSSARARVEVGTCSWWIWTVLPSAPGPSGSGIGKPRFPSREQPSYDDIVQGREGEYRVRLAKNHKGADCAYPGVEVLPGGTFVTTTYGHWKPQEAPYILSVRFRLTELDQKARK